METIVIRPRNKEESQLIRDMCHKMGLDTQSLSEEEVEELGLAVMLNEADRSETVDRQEIMEKLNRR